MREMVPRLIPGVNIKCYVLYLLFFQDSCQPRLGLTPMAQNGFMHRHLAAFWV